MSRLEVIDAIRRELFRQGARGRLSANVGRVPDTYVVSGILDIDELAKAITGERP